MKQTETEMALNYSRQIIDGLNFKFELDFK